jgi:hypothetical protein
MILKLLSIVSVLVFSTLAPAQCRTRVVAVQHQAAVAVEVAPVYQAVTVAIPTYSVGYPQPQGIAPEHFKVIVDELLKLRSEVDVLKQGRPILKEKAELIPAPKQSANPTNIFPDLPQVKQEAHVAILAAKCASCHDKRVADTKGGKFTLLYANELVSLTDGQKLKILAMLYTGAMPKNGKALSDEEFGSIIGSLK